jgi:ankyrin repeat protein
VTEKAEAEAQARARMSMAGMSRERLFGGDLNAFCRHLQANAFVADEHDKDGNTILLRACHHNYSAIVNWLLDHNYSSLDECNNHGDNAVAVARLQGHNDLFTSLIRRSQTSLAAIVYILDEVSELYSAVEAPSAPTAGGQF